jgi:hypothetical protein
MENQENIALPNNLDELLPVGMLTSGGLIAEAIARVAQKQVGMPDWAAFHYAKNSDGTLEITGGIVSTHAGTKKWLGEHDIIQIRAEDVLSELNALNQQHGATSTAPEQRAIATITDKFTQPTSAGSAKKMQVVFALPDDPAEQLAILKRFHLSADICGAHVLACQLLDERFDEI